MFFYDKPSWHSCGYLLYSIFAATPAATNSTNWNKQNFAHTLHWSKFTVAPHGFPATALRSCFCMSTSLVCLHCLSRNCLTLNRKKLRTDEEQMGPLEDGWTWDQVECRWVQCGLCMWNCWGKQLGIGHDLGGGWDPQIHWRRNVPCPIGILV